MADAIRASIAATPVVDQVLELRAVQMGTKQLLVLARVSLQDDVPAGQIERLMVKVRERLRHEHPEVIDSYLEIVP